MLKLICLFVACIVVAQANKPLYGSPECQAALQKDCSGFSYEPVCAHNGHTLVTYDNSCLFAQGICSHHGHSVYAEHMGAC